MSTTTIELETRRSLTRLSHQFNHNHFQSENNLTSQDVVTLPPDNASTVIPDGGYGWVVVFACSVITFWFSGLTGAFGVIQTALLSTTFKNTAPSTTAFIGSLGITICVAFGLIAVRLMRWTGVRHAATLGVMLLGIGTFTSSFTTTNVAGLFQTYGVILGIGDCLCYTAANVMPIQYFNRHLGLANGLVKLGGGLGATILSITVNFLVTNVGVPWTFRILGFMVLATGIPAALAIKERTPLPNVPMVDFSLFKNIPFTAVFLSGATVTFTLFIPPFFLPLFAESLGLSSGVGAGIVAAFNACTTVGRFAAGPLCDRIGPLNTFACTVVLNAVTTLAIWPISSTLPPLIVFAILNGMANGAFFTTLPMVVVSMLDPSRAAVGMALSITGWSAGYLLGTPIAGFLLQASGTGKGDFSGVDAYRPAIFYAGGIATVSSGLVIFARLFMDRKLLKKL